MPIRMKTLSIRDLRNRPGLARSDLGEDGQALLTSNGRPVAVMIGVTAETLDETLQLVQQVRMQRALRELRRQARESGTDRLNSDAIEQVIAEARALHRSATR